MTIKKIIHQVNINTFNQMPLEGVVSIFKNMILVYGQSAKFNIEYFPDVDPVFTVIEEREIPPLEIKERAELKRLQEKYGYCID